MSKSRCVLVIDDDEAIRLVIEACLVALSSWSVLLASSGEAGLALALSEQPDGILLDVSMPDMDGLAALQHLKANFQTAAIPVVLLTGKVQLTDQDVFSHLPIAATIAKPFDPLSLVEQLTKVWGWAD